MTDTHEICYEKALEYWSGIPATVDGVLGGFGFISDIDIEGSKLFLKSILTLSNAPLTNVALDCGAGIGRITKCLLIPNFHSVDVVEPDEKFINSIHDYVGNKAAKLGTLYKLSLQEFQPNKKYDVIWIQWVLPYLKDEDLILFLVICRFGCCSHVTVYSDPHKGNLAYPQPWSATQTFGGEEAAMQELTCATKPSKYMLHRPRVPPPPLFKNALSENGVIIVKENVTSSGKIEKDHADSSVTRPLKEFLKLFSKAKLKRIKQCKQTNFPNGLYPVYMVALVPIS